MRKVRLRKRVRLTLLILFGIIIAIIIANLICDSSSSFDNYAAMCDREKGSLCTYYEVRNYMINK